MSRAETSKEGITFCRGRESLRGSGLPFFFTLCVLAAMPAIYLSQQNPEPAAAAPGRKESVTPAPGQRGFERQCAPCHGLDGRGGEHAPAIATARAAGAMDDKAVFQIIRGGIPAKGMPSFDSLADADVHAIIAYLRLLTGKQTARPAKGNPARGEQLFFAKARCGDCHMMMGKGGFIGSDLTDFAGSHSIDELRRAILDPGQWIPPEQQAVTVTTRSQERVTGLVRNEDNFSLQLQDADGVFHLFQKSQVASIDREGRPLMPEDYGTRLTPTELDDLISFMFSGLPAPAHASAIAGRAVPKAVPNETPKSVSK